VPEAGRPPRAAACDDVLEKNRRAEGKARQTQQRPEGRGEGEVVAAQGDDDRVALAHGLRCRRILL